MTKSGNNKPKPGDSESSGEEIESPPMAAPNEAELTENELTAEELDSVVAPQPIQSELESLQAQADEYLDGWQRARAEFAKHPNDPEALTHMGVILVQAGHADAALQMFDRALAADPKYVHALWDKANLLFEQRQDYAGAAKTLEAFIALAAPGPDVERAKTMIVEAKKRQSEPKPAAESQAPAAPSERQSLR